MLTGKLVQLPGDTTIEIRASGWTFFTGTKTVGALPPEVSMKLVNRQTDVPYGANASGSLLIVTHSSDDTYSAVLVNRTTAAREILTTLAFDEIKRGGGSRPVCKLAETVVLAPDGWIGVLRKDPYRVDWRTATGEWVHGAPIPYPQLPMNDQEKKVYLEWRDRDYPTTNADNVRSWPKQVCPWVGGFAPLATPDGKMLVYRVPTTA
ncbi:MAG: hypothetical protein ABJB74_20920, partial [Gemmatimonas sp.]